MTWLTPWAWALAVAALLPLVAHLWSRARPAPVPFPTLRFLRAASPVSRRLRDVQDWPLLLLRLAIVAVICAAAAGPTLVSAVREQAWKARLHRVILETGRQEGRTAGEQGRRAGEQGRRAGEQGSTAGGQGRRAGEQGRRAGEQGRTAGDQGGGEVEAVAEARRTAWSSSIVGPGPVGEVLGEAIAEADRRAAGMRTEIVVVWDGSRDAFVPADLTDVPARVGIRLVVVDDGDAAGAGGTGGVGIVAAAVDDAARDLVVAALDRSVASIGPRPSSGDAAPAVVIAWPGASLDAPTPAATPADLRRLLDEIADDPRVRDAAERSRRDPRAPDAVDAPGRRLVLATDGAPLLRGWSAGEHVVLALDAEPTSPLALWAALAAQESLTHPWRLVGPRERWTPAEIAAAQRESATPERVSLPGGLDTRAAWVVLLALLAAEQWWRRRPATPADEVTADAG